MLAQRGADADAKMITAPIKHNETLAAAAEQLAVKEAKHAATLRQTGEDAAAAAASAAATEALNS